MSLTDLLSDATGTVTQRKLGRLSELVHALPKDHGLDSIDQDSGELVPVTYILEEINRVAQELVLAKRIGLVMAGGSVSYITTQKQTLFGSIIAGALAFAGGVTWCYGTIQGLKIHRQLDKLTHLVETYALNRKIDLQHIHSIYDLKRYTDLTTKDRTY